MGEKKYKTFRRRCEKRYAQRDVGRWGQRQLSHVVAVVQRLASGSMISIHGGGDGGGGVEGAWVRRTGKKMSTSIFSIKVKPTGTAPADRRCVFTDMQSTYARTACWMYTPCYRTVSKGVLAERNGHVPMDIGRERTGQVGSDRRALGLSHSHVCGIGQMSERETGAADRRRGEDILGKQTAAGRALRHDSTNATNTFVRFNIFDLLAFI